MARRQGEERRQERMEEARKLLKMGEEGFRIAEDLAHSPDDRLRGVAAIYFCACNDPRAADRLRPLLSDECPDVRLRALRSYAAQIHPARSKKERRPRRVQKPPPSVPPGIDALLPMIGDSDVKVRSCAVEALAAYAPLRDRRIESALQQALNDPKHQVRHAAARALGVTCPGCGVRAGVSKSSVSHVEIIVVSSVEAYRQWARELAAPTDAVLEIGCSTGVTTRILASKAAQVVAVDNSVLLTERLRGELAGRGNVQVALADGRDIPKLIALLAEPTLIFLDIGGNARLDNVALQARLCLTAFRPRAMVVRSAEMTQFLSLVSTVEPPQADQDRWVGRSRSGDDWIAYLLDLSHSSSVESRVFAARQMRSHDKAALRKRLQEMAADNNPSVRRAAAMALRGLGEAQVQP